MVAMVHLGSHGSNSILSEFDLEQVQPNAIDLKADKISRIDNNTFQISEEGKNHRGSAPIALDEEGYWNLENGTYEIIMEGIVTIGSDEAGLSLIHI